MFTETRCLCLAEKQGVGFHNKEGHVAHPIETLEIPPRIYPSITFEELMIKTDGAMGNHSTIGQRTQREYIQAQGHTHQSSFIVKLAVSKKITNWLTVNSILASFRIQKWLNLVRAILVYFNE